MRRALLVSLGLHLTLIGGALWWLMGERESNPPLAIRVDLGPSELAARRTSVPRSVVPTPSPELPPADTVPEPSPDQRSDSEPGTSGESGGPVIDALTPGQSLEKPALLGYPPPEYPRDARHRGWEGVVEALVTVDKTGRAVEITLSKSSGHPSLDDAALTALRGARYKPGSADGAPATATMTVTVRFRLQ